MYPPKYLLYSFLAYSLLTLTFYFLPHIMDIFIKIVQFVLSLSILVLFHEFGHFLFAKLFKTRVEKFYMFFNPWFSLFKFKKGETEYGVGWLPLGGYVKIAGMIDESMDTEQMKQPAQPWEFRAKPAWQRLLIMLGGVLVNVLLAFVIYIGILFTWGETYLPAKNVTYGVVCDSVFKNIGMRNGDIIVALDNKEVVRFDDVLPEILFNRSKTIQVLRNGEQVSLDIPDDFIATLLELSSKSFKLNPLLTPVSRSMESRYRTSGIILWLMMQVCEKGIRFCLSTDILFVSTMNFRICSPPIKESGWKRPYCGERIHYLMLLLWGKTENSVFILC